MEEESAGGGRSLAETPAWAVASVIGVMVCFSYIFHLSLKMFGKWLDKTKSNSLLSALKKIQEELMLFGVLSLLMGHWIEFVAKICVKQSALSSRFMPCASKDGLTVRIAEVSTSEYLIDTVSREQDTTWERNYCPEGQESFASYECLEQLHRFIFVLGITHVSTALLLLHWLWLRFIAGKHGKTKLRQWLLRVHKTPIELEHII